MVKSIFAVLMKDIRSELRTRYAVNAIVMFAVVTVVAISFSTGGIPLETNITSIVLWLAIYFASVASLSQSFVKEEQNRTALALRIYGTPGAVFGGKYLFNLLLLSFLVIIIVLLFALFVGLGIHCYSLFIAIMVLSVLGFAGSTTIIAAIISKASIKGVLFAVLSFPLILPLLIMAIKGTEVALMENMTFAAGLTEIKVLLSYAVVMTIAGALLFEYVWND